MQRVFKNTKTIRAIGPIGSERLWEIRTKFLFLTNNPRRVSLLDVFAVPKDFARVVHILRFRTSTIFQAEEERDRRCMIVSPEPTHSSATLAAGRVRRGSTPRPIPPAVPSDDSTVLDARAGFRAGPRSIARADTTSPCSI